MGSDNASELANRKEFKPKEPEFTQAQKDEHADEEKKRKQRGLRMIKAWQAKLTALEQRKESERTLDTTIKIAELHNLIEEKRAEIDKDFPLCLSGDDETVRLGLWKAYRERVSRLELRRGQVYSLLLGQCTQQLQDRMKQDDTWDAVSESYSPLQLLDLIEKVVMAQTDDQYPFAVAYEHQRALMAFQQNDMSNATWYERFYTKAEVGLSLGLEYLHPCLLDWQTHHDHETLTKFEELTTDDEKAEVCANAQERMLTYIMMQQSGKFADKLRNDTRDDYLKSLGQYPGTRTELLNLLDRYSRAPVRPTITSEGTSFAQKGGSGGKKSGAAFDPTFWKDKTCHNCGEKGHPKAACPKPKKANKKKDDDDDASKASRSTKSSRSGMKGDYKKGLKEIKKLGKTLTTLQETIQEAQEESVSSDVSEEEEGSQHFQFGVAFVTKGEEVDEKPSASDLK